MRVKETCSMVDELLGNRNSVTLARGNSPTAALDAAAPATPPASPATTPLPEIAPAEPAPSLEASACLASVIEVQGELSAVGLDAETIMRVSAERAGALTGADGV